MIENSLIVISKATSCSQIWFWLLFDDCFRIWIWTQVITHVGFLIFMTDKSWVICNWPESDELLEDELESSLESSELEDSFFDFVDLFDLLDLVDPCRDFNARSPSTSSTVFDSLIPNWTVLENMSDFLLLISYESSWMSNRPGSTFEYSTVWCSSLFCFWLKGHSKVGILTEGNLKKWFMKKFDTH